MNVLKPRNWCFYTFTPSTLVRTAGRRSAQTVPPSAALRHVRNYDRTTSSFVPVYSKISSFIYIFSGTHPHLQRGPHLNCPGIPSDDIFGRGCPTITAVRDLRRSSTARRNVMCTSSSNVAKYYPYSFYAVNNWSTEMWARAFAFLA